MIEKTIIEKEKEFMIIDQFRNTKLNQLSGSFASIKKFTNENFQKILNKHLMEMLDILNI